MVCPEWWLSTTRHSGIDIHTCQNRPHVISQQQEIDNSWEHLQLIPLVELSIFPYFLILGGVCFTSSLWGQKVGDFTSKGVI